MLQARVRPSAEHQRSNFKTMLGVIQGARRLPSPPAIVARLTELLADPDYQTSELVRLVSMDPALAAEVLNLANSAIYARSAGPVQSVQKAIETIGDRELMQLLVARSAKGLRSRELTGYTLGDGGLWRRSITVAVAAGLLARRTTHTPWSRAYTVGLLMDIGLLAMGDAMKSRIGLRATDGDVSDLDDFELHLVGIDHAELGRRLARKWELPKAVIAGIAFHHRPSEAGPFKHLAYVAHGADDLVTRLLGDLQAGDITPSFDTRWMDIVAVSEDDIDGLLTTIQTEVDAAMRSLGVAG